jgi:hypothetical protein
VTASARALCAGFLNPRLSGCRPVVIHCDLDPFTDSNFTLFLVHAAVFLPPDYGSTANLEKL